jgi:DNA-binding HxlR family transcriptional regulator
LVSFHRILSERLSELEEEKLIKRIVTNTKPIVIEYEITEKGADLRSVFRCCCNWGKKWGKRK